MATRPLPTPEASQLLRYLVVGAGNTLFGYGLFVLLTMLLTPTMKYGYLLASLLGNIISITFAFLGYKWFVFKTRGHYLTEWIRCLGVYATSMVLSLATLPFLVALVRRATGLDQKAPYIAGAILLLFSVMFSFLGHRHFSFSPRKPANETFRNCDNP
jgi:putative flippase GtrA